MLPKLEALRDSGTRVPALENRPAAELWDAFHLRAALMLMETSGQAVTLPLADLLSYAHAMGLTADEAFELRDVLSEGVSALNEHRAQQRKGKAGGSGTGANTVNAGKGNERPS